MKKPFIPEISYIRGLCMLGVIAIHVGSYAILNPSTSPHVIIFMEIASRFSIPAFFFLSSFGLFYHTPTTETFSYTHFMKRRFNVVAIPYLTWSFLYLAYNAAVLHSPAGFLPRYLLPTLFFGTASYHLYFIVIIMWFYITMPLWRWMIKKMHGHVVLWLTLFFILQTIFNFYSSYRMSSIHFDNIVIQYLLDMRLNYWVLHYVWVWLLGAAVAENYDTVIAYIYKHELYVISAFGLSMATMIGSYYYLTYEWGYTPLEAVNTVHQLSPMGMLYTGCAIFFFLYAFHKTAFTREWHLFWEEAGKDSYGMYLIHPFILIIYTHFLTKYHITYGTLVVAGLYIVTVLTAMRLTISMREAPLVLRKLLLGR